MRILAVDDNESCLRAIADVVRATGFELVASARTGEEAVRLHDALRPDLVLLDVQLPEIDGYEVARRIGSARVVLMSAEPRPGVLAKATLTPDLLRGLSR